jgi:hypothetical protein
MMANQDNDDIINALQSLANGEDTADGESEGQTTPAQRAAAQNASVSPRPVSPAAAQSPARKLAPIQPSPAAIEKQRTLIPILLTGTVLLWIFATLRFVVYADSPLAQLPLWGSILGYIAGVFLLMIAIANMLYVRHLTRPQTN